jgi:hypothetical protein
VSAHVVDTGVLIAANGREEEIDPECVKKCIAALLAVREGTLVLDEGMEIFREYMTYGSFSGQPGVGDAFFKWVADNRYNDAVCERVELVPHPDRIFEAFPQDPELESFDPSDRKFVAAALTSVNDPTLLIAVDSDWWDHREALQANGVKIDFLCPEHFTEKARKHGRKQPRSRRKSS